MRYRDSQQKAIMHKRVVCVPGNAVSTHICRVLFLQTKPSHLLLERSRTCVASRHSGSHGEYDNAEPDNCQAWSVKTSTVGYVMVMERITMLKILRYKHYKRMAWKQVFRVWERTIRP